MKLTRARSFALAVAVAALPAKAQQPPHHPAGAANQIHDKMLAAKTPDERQALMAEHMKSMQDGRSMMTMMMDRMPPAPPR